MQFFKFKCVVAQNERMQAANEEEARTRAQTLAAAAETFNSKAAEDTCCFLSEIEKNTLTGGVMLARGSSPQTLTRRFVSAIGFLPQKLTAEEITLRGFCNMARRADRKGYLEDDDELLEDFGLSDLARNGFPHLEYRETLLEPETSMEKLTEEARRLACEDTLVPELERIFARKRAAKTVGHPVHYTIETDSDAIGSGVQKTLLKALLGCGRLGSSKAVTVSPFGRSEISEDKYDTLYRCCEGGTVAVRMAAPDVDEDEFADAEVGILETVCAAAKKYRRRTLTVFLLPRACEHIRKQLYEELGDISLVELREDNMKEERAAAFLQRLARENAVRTDKALIKQLEPDRSYLPDELRKLFDDWYERKLKTGLYPQYAAFGSCREQTVKTAPKGNAFEELRNMTGLSEAKQVITKALDYYKLQRVYKDNGVMQDRPAMHMVFTGSPGTAKTTTARLFARIMKENGMLSKGHLVEVGRSDLVGKYVGWTAQIVQRQFKAAMGGVLFIDEAYALADDRGGSYGDEAINTIVQEMENRREDLVVIFAGYPAEMERFLNKNPGLRSRVAFHVPFADYTADELCEIAAHIAAQKGVSLSGGAAQKLRTAFEAACLQPDFGNGRYARSLIEQAKMNMAGRILAMDAGKVTKQILTRIEETDIELPETKPAVRGNVIGFTA